MSSTLPVDLSRPVRRILPSFVAGALALATWTTTAWAEEATIPGTTVTMEVPAGFSVASSFAGLENSDNGSTIVITELPLEAYADLIEVFSDVEAATNGLASSGIVVERTLKVTSAQQQQVPIVVGTQIIGGTDIGKYLALLRRDSAVLITFNVLQDGALTQAQVESVVGSVTLAPAPTLEEKLSELPFSFEISAPFTIGDTFSGSAVSLPTFEGRDATGLLPMAIITRALKPTPPGADLKLVSKALASSTQGFEEAQLTVYKEMNFAGGPGYYMEVATADRTLVQFLRIPRDGMFVRMIAYGDTRQLENVRPAVSAIAGSISIR